jgi:hypothetical protein
MHDSNPRILFYVGVAAVALGFCMTFEFGRSMSLFHAGAMGLLTIAAAYVWGPIETRWHNGRRKSAVLLGAFGVLFIAVELFSHLGYTVGHRIRDTEEATVQNMRFDSAQEAVGEDKTNLAMWKKRLEALETEHAWAATVTAEALRAQLANANLAIELESKRGGCKSKCLARTKERDDIATKIALAEEKADLTKKIEATKRVVDTARVKADTTEFKTSKIISQTKFVSQLATFELEPGKGAMTWAQIGIGFLVALVTTFLGPVCIFLSGRNIGDILRKEDRANETKWAASGPEPAPTQMTKMRSSFRDRYNRHCNTLNIGAIPRTA